MQVHPAPEAFVTREAILARRLIRLEAAAEQLDCSTRTVRRFVAAGDLTAFRVGKRMIRVDLNEVDALLRRIPSASDAA